MRRLRTIQRGGGLWYELLPWSRHLLGGIEGAGTLLPLAVTVVVGGSCLLATLLPAVRTTGVDPVVTLRAE